MFHSIRRPDSGFIIRARNLPKCSPAPSICCFLLVGLVTLASFCQPVFASELTIVSTDSNGQIPGEDSDSPFVSRDGRFILFRSSKLVPEDTVGSQLYLRDMQTGELELISVNTSGNSSSAFPELPLTPNASPMSEDGRYVAFRSTAADLIDGFDPAGIKQLFMRDRQLGTVTLISKNSLGEPANGDTEHYAITLGGGFVRIYFNSRATNLDDLDIDTNTNTYQHETLNNTTRVACVLCDENGENCAPFPGGCQSFSINCAGGAIAFMTAQTITGDDNNFASDVFVGEPFNGTYEMMSRHHNGGPGVSSTHTPPSVSCGGNRVLFQTNTPMIISDVGINPNLYMRDRLTDQVWLIPNVQVDGGPGSNAPALSPSGYFVAFGTNNDLVPNDEDGALDVYALEFPVNGPPGAPFLVSQCDDVPANRQAFSPVVSDTGRVAFVSRATNLVSPTTASSRLKVFAISGSGIFVDGFESSVSCQ